MSLQNYISKWADHAQWNLNVIRFIKLPEPQLPILSDVEIAQVSLFASDQVRDASNEFGMVVSGYSFAIEKLNEVRKVQSMIGPATPELLPTLSDLRARAQEVVVSAALVHSLLRSELQGSD
jgi:hypothetical protein